MEDFFVFLLVIGLTFNYVWIGMNDLLDTQEKEVMLSCDKKGYWQYKQERYLCKKEEK